MAIVGSCGFSNSARVLVQEDLEGAQEELRSLDKVSASPACVFELAGAHATCAYNFQCC